MDVPKEFPQRSTSDNFLEYDFFSENVSLGDIPGNDTTEDIPGDVPGDGILGNYHPQMDFPADQSFGKDVKKDDENGK